MHAYLIMKTSFSNKLSVSHRRTIDSSQSESPHRLNTCSMFSATTSQLSQDPYHIRVFFQDSTDIQIYICIYIYIYIYHISYAPDLLTHTPYIYISYAPDLLTHTPYIYIYAPDLLTHTHIHMYIYIYIYALIIMNILGRDVPRFWN